MIIGISGKMGAGKTTLAKAIIGVDSHYGYRPFAKGLKEACRTVFGLTHEQLYGSLKNTVDPRWGQAPREMLQKFGTEVGRSIHPNTWVWQTMDAIGEGDAVVDDVRYPNEADAIRKAGGIVIRVERKDRPATDFDRHVSETSLDNYKFDMVVESQPSNGTGNALLAKDVLQFADDRLAAQQAAAARQMYILHAIRAERARQDAKFGTSNDDILLVPPDMDVEAATFRANWAKEQCDRASARGESSWSLILKEEVYEAIAEAATGDIDKLEVELVQVAAVCVKWCEQLRRIKDTK